MPHHSNLLHFRAFARRDGRKMPKPGMHSYFDTHEPTKLVAQQIYHIRHNHVSGEKNLDSRTPTNKHNFRCPCLSIPRPEGLYTNEDILSNKTQNLASLCMANSHFSDTF